MRADAASARSEGSPTAQRTWVQRGRGWRRPRGAVSQLGLLVSRALRCPPLPALGLPENGTWASIADLLGNLKKSEESGLLGSVCKVKGSAPPNTGLVQDPVSSGTSVGPAFLDQQQLWAVGLLRPLSSSGGTGPVSPSLWAKVTGPSVPTKR